MPSTGRLSRHLSALERTIQIHSFIVDSIILQLCRKQFATDYVIENFVVMFDITSFDIRLLSSGIGF